MVPCGGGGAVLRACYTTKILHSSLSSLYTVYTYIKFMYLHIYICIYMRILYIPTYYKNRKNQKKKITYIQSLYKKP